MHLENFRALENVSSDQRIVGILKVVILVVIFAVLDLLLQLNFHFGILRAPWSVLLPEDKLLEENAVLRGQTIVILNILLINLVEYLCQIVRLLL